MEDVDMVLLIGVFRCDDGPLLERIFLLEVINNAVCFGDRIGQIISRP